MVLNPEKINLWRATPEEDAAWEAHRAKQAAIGRASPAQAREKNNRLLCDILGAMVYPLGPSRHELARGHRPGPCRSDATLAGGHIRYDIPVGKPLQKGEYPGNAHDRLSSALGLYCRVYRKTQPCSTAQEEENLCEMPLHSKSLILDSCEIAKWPYKLGAALYLHQQMVVRKKDKEPSQGKAQWLVAKAPVKPIERGGQIPLRPDGGEPSKIGDQWKRYFTVAHYWAAFVVWAKTPLEHPTDRYALIDFVCNADADEFLANAAAFKKFRSELNVERAKVVPFIKQGSNSYEPILDEIVPTDQYLIPDLLAPYQWAALQGYKTRPRTSRF